jgi:hypothetical protein
MADQAGKDGRDGSDGINGKDGTNGVLGLVGREPLSFLIYFLNCFIHFSCECFRT